MRTIKIKRRVKSTLLKIRELEQYKGKNIEMEIKVKEMKLKKPKNKIKGIAGAFAKYADINLIKKENQAWALAVREKNEDYRR